MDDSNKTRIQDFYASFQASRTDLSSRLEALKSTGQSDPEKLNELITDAAKLRKDLVDSTSFLPTYDQRQYEQSLELALEELRTSSAPKPKFAFKRKAPKTASIPAAGVIASEPAKAERVPVGSSAAPSSHLLLSGHKRRYLDRTSLPTLESSSDLTISDLDHCIVNLLPLSSSDPAHNVQACTFTALHVRNLTRTALVLPPINGSALLHDLKHCTIVLGCHQFRMHTSREVDVYLSIGSNPIIEHCASIRFAEYPSAVASVCDPSTGILYETSKHLAVQDFSHIRATPSPNWSVLPIEELPSSEDWFHVVRKGADIDFEKPDPVLQRLLAP